jgi:hypothetical protein
MHDPSFDGGRAVVTDSPPAGPFVEATDIQLTFQTYGFRLKAVSQGRSMLPFQYSRCWSISGEGEPSLFRANLMELGVSFSGELDARLAFRYGLILATAGSPIFAMRIDCGCARRGTGVPGPIEDVDKLGSETLRGNEQGRMDRGQVESPR